MRTHTFLLQTSVHLEIRFSLPSLAYLVLSNSLLHGEISLPFSVKTFLIISSKALSPSREY